MKVAYIILGTILTYPSRGSGFRNGHFKTKVMILMVSDSIPNTSSLRLQEPDMSFCYRMCSTSSVGWSTGTGGVPAFSGTMALTYAPPCATPANATLAKTQPAEKSCFVGSPKWDPEFLGPIS